MSAQPHSNINFVTPEEYLRAERNAELRHEYIDGQVVAMAGASVAHIDIVGALMGMFYNQLRKSPCVARANEMRVKTPNERLFTYPDIVVSCNSQFQPHEFDTLVNPVVIIEVLSPSTQTIDRGEKFIRYRQISSLRDYVLISQDQMLVEHRSRSQQIDGDHWWLRFLEKPEKELVLDSVNCRLPLADIYERVTFGSDAAR